MRRKRRKRRGEEKRWKRRRDNKSESVKMLGRGEMRSGKGGGKIGCCRVSIEKVENGRAIDNQRGISVRILFSVERIVMIIRNIFWMYTMRGFLV